MTLRERAAAVASATATSVLVVCAVAVVVLLARRDVAAGERSKRAARFTEQGDWKSYLTAGRRIGRDSAPVVLIAFSDYQCPACGAFEEAVRNTMAKHGHDVSVAYRHFPLERIHPFAFDAAVASECGEAQGRFPQMHRELFDARDSIGVTAWRDYARRAGVPDLELFTRCMADSSIAAVVRRDLAAAKRLGARGTPTILIGSVRFTGAVPQHTLDSLVGDAVSRARTEQRSVSR